jgi:hypothetical protein
VQEYNLTGRATTRNIKIDLNEGALGMCVCHRSHGTMLYMLHVSSKRFDNEYGVARRSWRPLLAFHRHTNHFRGFSAGDLLYATLPGFHRLLATNTNFIALCVAGMAMARYPDVMVHCSRKLELLFQVDLKPAFKAARTNDLNALRVRR